MKIRKATRKDAKIIQELLNSDPNLRGSEADKAAKEDIKQFLTDNIHRVYVYEEDKKIAAVMVAQFFKTAKFIYLFYIAVDKNYQRKGIATKLFNHLEGIARKEGYYLIELLAKEENSKMSQFMKKIKYSRGGKYRFYYKLLKWK
ncbi:MAG: GNAT family N-acetyltransferase [Nanoarchaeota archaeon]|nr:GNAT family N-acetyltransferase [Nanoarchaeota archaeon]